VGQGFRRRLEPEHKSGTNTFRGEAYEYIRNKVFNANDWFSNNSGLKGRPGSRISLAATSAEEFSRTEPSSLQL